MKVLEFPFDKLHFFKPSDSTFINIDRIAKTKAPILITGEPGTGKELFARYLHMKSHRAEKPFISLNCSDKSEVIVENELFGHGRIKGKLEQCDGGTFFLNEVGELPIMIQLRILRVLKEMEFERVGGTSLYKIDVRFIVASSKDLKHEVELGKFREELFYRLSVINFTVPPLRKNPKAIRPLIDYYINKYAIQNSKKIFITSDAEQILMQHNWSGNIFEMENIIERAVMLCIDNCITPNDLAITSSHKLSPFEYIEQKIDIDILMSSKIRLPELIERIEESIIRRAMKKCNHIQVRVAEMLGITKSLLQYKMKKYNISPQL